MKLFYLGLLFVALSCGVDSTNNGAVPGVNTLSAGQVNTVIEIEPEELLKLLKYDKNAFVVDVRPPTEKSRSCKLIKGYQHIRDSLIYRDPEVLPKGKTIVLLSRTGKRSRKVARFLSRHGYAVYNLKNGMDGYWAWREKVIRAKLKIYSKEIDVIELYADDFGC